MASMSRENIGFTSKGYNRSEVDFVLDRSFTQFGQQSEETEKTVEQFFVDYEDLFFQIPVEGETNSLEYLVKKSSELLRLYNSGSSLEDIQPLLDEITMLRSQSVVDQQTIVDLRTQLATIGVNGSDTATVASLRTELAEALNESNQQI